ncbi:hypothetical protein [Pedobacter psychroterrae]|uniref:Lumazine-binding protein n=1 Tax=Pedobacter psychroterrae TaxID=2530453 RepID=A0A4V2ML94_9SPHI|nr:hypothetical protein [Pedobacter psychroterrae]TCD01147.1 hypothetical protein EZ437_10295 [Pedobacter psychroterrae]
MKRKILMLLAILSISATVALAKDDNPVKNLNARAVTVLDAYIEAHIHNNAALFNRILDDGAVLKVNKQDQIVQHHKKDLVRFYKKGGELLLNCEASQEILSECDCIVMARVDFKFPEFVQQNYIQLEKDKEGNWKITQINRFNV